MSVVLHFDSLALILLRIQRFSLVCLAPWPLGLSQPIDGLTFSFALAVFAFFAALLMVSNVRYYNPKNIKGQVPFRYMFLVILMFVSILIYPPGMLLVIGTVYALSGPVLALGRRLQKHGE